MLLAVTVALCGIASGERLFMSIGPDGVPVVTDYPRKEAVTYAPGDFERIALGQKNEPHVGLGALEDGAVLFHAPIAPHDVEPLIQAASKKHGVPVPLLRAVIATESSFRVDAVSPAGAMGLMQLMPGTAKDMGVADPFDPAQNVNGGARYLGFLLKHFKDVDVALAAYNAGPGRVARNGGRIPDIPETQRYVVQVRELAASYERGGSSR